jgi:hypothetical protein
MSEKNPQEQKNTADETPITDGDLETVAGGVIDGCFPTEPTDPILPSGPFIIQ